MSDILVLLSEPDLRNRVIRSIEADGHTPWIATDDAEVLDQVIGGQFDAVIVDLVAAGIDGLAAGAAARVARRKVWVVAVHAMGATPGTTSDLAALSDIDRIVHLNALDQALAASLAALPACSRAVAVRPRVPAAAG